MGVILQQCKKIRSGLDVDDVSLMGISGITPTLTDENNNLLSEIPNDWVFKKYLLAVDALHDCKGNLKKIIQTEYGRNDFKKKKFLESLQKLTGKEAISDLNGSGLRIMMLLYKKSLLPFISENRKLSWAQMAKEWVEIQWKKDCIFQV